MVIAFRMRHQLLHMQETSLLKDKKNWRYDVKNQSGASYFSFLYGVYRCVLETNLLHNFLLSENDERKDDNYSSGITVIFRLNFIICIQKKLTKTIILHYQRISRRTAELQNGAEDFASLANELVKAMENRKWWQV